MDFKKISIIVIALIFLLAAIILFFSVSDYKYSKEYNGVLFVSNYKNPDEFLQEFSSKKTFFSVLIRYPKSNTTQYMDNANVLAILVLKGNDKNVVQVIRDIGLKGEEYCSTNFGNYKTSVDLNKEECDLFLASGINAVKIFLNFPDSSLQKPKIVFGNNEIQIMPKSYKDISATTFYALEAMFPNARDVVSKANIILGKVS